MPLATARRNLLFRLSTASILLPVALAAVWAGNPALFILTAILVLLGLWEMRSIAIAAGWGFISWVAFPLAVAFLLLPLSNQSQAIVLAAIAAAAIAAGLVASALKNSSASRWSGLAAATGSALYVGGLAAALPATRGESAGLAWVLILLAAVWSYDIAAYFTGTAIGRHCLAPQLSPSKSWEGVAGGLTGAIATAAIVSLFFTVGLWIALLAAAFISLAAQVGDLFESALKRRANLKDSGRLLPGHGGILDRVDSLLFAGPVAYAFAAFSSGPG